MIKKYSLKKFSVLSVIMVTIASMLGFFLLPALTSADINPPGCLNNDFVVNLNKSTAVAYDETNPNGATMITYSVDAGNPQDISGKGCNVDNVTITITDPHGVVHTIQSGGNYPIGTMVTTLGTTVSYTANSSDEMSDNLNDSLDAIGDIHNKPSGTNPIHITKADTVTVIHPNTTVTITSSHSAVESGGTVDLTITEQNTGDDSLTSPSVTVDNGIGTLIKSSGSFTGGDTNSDGILDPGETWTWVVTGIVVSTNTTYTAVGNGTDSLGNPVTSPSYPNEKASADVKVVDAKISITPDGTNEINKTHTFTGHVEVNDGSGFANAPDGTVIDFTIASGPGSLDTPSCTTSSGTGSCTDGLTSAIPGVTVVNASTDVTVSSVLLHRITDGANGNSGPATKTWVDANIQISPLQATDPVNDQHELTGHVNVNTGTGGYVNAPDGTVIDFAIVSGPGSLSSPSCTTSGGTGSCTDILTSAVVGTTVVNATTDVVVGSVTLHRSTDGVGSNSGSANKTWILLDSTTVTVIHDASHNVITTASAGDMVHDNATVSGSGPTPTGNVDFQLFSDGNCQNANGAPQVVALSGGIAESSPVVATAPAISYKAHYEGDGTYNPSDGSCEPLTVNVNKVTPTIQTTPSAGGDVGVVLNDTATLSGGSNPTGTIVFNLYDPTNTTCNGIGVYTQTITVSGNGTYGTTPGFTSNVDGVWRWTAAYSGDTNNNAVTSGCNDEQVTVTKPQQVTRTLGFWQTHTTYTESVFAAHGPITLGGMTITTNGQLFGGFYADISKKSDGSKRSALDQARMQLAQQYLAAVLNCQAFGCSASTMTLLSQASGDFSSGTASQILADASQLDAYNNSGDSLGNPAAGSATPSLSQSLANKAFWDVLS